MAKPITPDQAEERAKRAQQRQIDTVRVLADARKSLAEIKATTDDELADLKRSITLRITDAERTDSQAYDAALAAGWSASQLRKIGFTEPARRTATRRRTSRKPAPSAPATPDYEDPDLP